MSSCDDHSSMYQADLPIGFSAVSTTATLRGGAATRRAGTIMRSPADERYKDKDKAFDGDLRASEVRPLASSSTGR